MSTPSNVSGRVEVSAVPVDAPSSAALLRTYFADVAARYYGRPATDAELDVAMAEDPSDRLAPPHGVFLVAAVDGDTVGCVGLHTLEPGVAELKRMFVRETARGRGVGTRLLAAAEDAAAGLGAAVIRLDTRDDLVEARRLYARHGYTEIPAYTDGPYAERFYQKYLR